MTKSYDRTKEKKTRDLEKKFKKLIILTRFQVLIGKVPTFQDGEHKEDWIRKKMFRENIFHRGKVFHKRARNLYDRATSNERKATKYD